jgi:hypothetical protein
VPKTSKQLNSAIGSADNTVSLVYVFFMLY